MNNSDKSELRRELCRLDIVGYNQKQAIDIMEARGFKRQTIKRYWDALVGVNE